VPAGNNGHFFAKALSRQRAEGENWQGAFVRVSESLLAVADSKGALVDIAARAE
jgi:hypothetical protein